MLCGWSWFWSHWVVSVSNCCLCCFSVIQLGTEKCVCYFFDLYMQIFLEDQMCVREKWCQCNLKIMWWHLLAHLHLEVYYCLLINGSNIIVSFLECCHLSKHVFVMVTLPGVKLLKILGYLAWCCLFLNIPMIMSLYLLVAALENENVRCTFTITELERCLRCCRTNIPKPHFCNCSKCWSADTGEKISLQLGCAGNVVK